MERRAFLNLCAVSGGFALSPLPILGANDKAYTPPDIFPPSALVKHLFVAPLKKVSLIERQLYTSLQGLVSRKEPRIYYVRDDNDEMWLKYYGEQYGITHERVESAKALLEKFAGEMEGYIVYDPTMPDSRNVAQALGGLKNALPVHPDLVPQLEEVGLKKIDNLTGRWKDRYEAYRWILKEHFSQLNQRILGTNCVDEPHWPSASMWAEDYLIAHNIFTTDLSACRRDREDRKLLSEIYSAVEAPGYLMGWRSARNVEHEMVGYAARHGIYTLCALSVLNLTVHTAIPKPTEPFKQRHVDPAKVGPVKKKVYVAFMNTDGDSFGSMMRLQSGRFLEPEHGKMPYTWGLLPLAFDLLPGVARYNYELKQENDYFTAATCGVAYTYPDLLPDTRGYLRYTRHYMDKMDLKTAYMSNWDDDFWWQEMETPGFIEKMREELPDTLGFVRGMGESAFEPHLFGEGAPYLFCGEGIHSDSDVYDTIVQFVEANTIRPLFVFCLVNHGTTLKRMHEAVDRLPKTDYEFVRLDEFFHLLEKARNEGLVGDELYPDKEGIRKILVDEARPGWRKQVDEILAHGDRAELDETAFRAETEDAMTRLVLDRSATPASDIVAFDAVWDSMRLTRLALNLKGINVNEKAKGVADFASTFGHVKEASVVAELWEAWERWEEEPVSYERGCAWAKRLAALAKALDAELG